MIARLYATESGDVHVWWFPCEQDVGELAAALGDDELRAAARFYAPAHRARYTTQHAIVRALLARYAGIAPRELRFGRGARGKPYLAGGFGIEHNLAHADDVALLAIAHTGTAVGVDVERLDARIDPAELAKTVLAPGEQGCVSRAAFLRVWCRKEACLKATGVGLVDDLPAIDVIGDGADGAVTIGGDRVYVQDLAIGDAHAAALATSVPVGPLYLVKSSISGVT